MCSDSRILSFRRAWKQSQLTKKKYMKRSSFWIKFGEKLNFKTISALKNWNEAVTKNKNEKMVKLAHTKIHVYIYIIYNIGQYTKSSKKSRLVVRCLVGPDLFCFTLLLCDFGSGFPDYILKFIRVYSIH